METQEQKMEHGKKCCCDKTVLFVLLFLVGGIIGYLLGHCRCCSDKRMCPNMPPPMEMGAAPMHPAKAK